LFGEGGIGGLGEDVHELMSLRVEGFKSC
jgi:hypothetical protein